MRNEKNSKRLENFRRRDNENKLITEMMMWRQRIRKKCEKFLLKTTIFSWIQKFWSVELVNSAWNMWKKTVMESRKEKKNPAQRWRRDQFQLDKQRISTVDSSMLL